MEDHILEGFAVKDLFSIPHFKEAILLGGGSGLDRMISRVNVMEVPDVVDWVRPGEFLMTTGYPFKDEPEMLVTLIAQLAEKGVVALGVKTKRFFDAVPKTAIKVADQYGIPLIEMPPSTTFSDVVREVMERVLVSESKNLSILQSRVQGLSHVLLHGDGLPAFLTHLQLMIKNPVVLLDPHNRWMASPVAERLCAQISDTDWEKIRKDQSLEITVLQIGDKAVRVHVMTVSQGQVPSYLLLILEDENEYGVVDRMTVSWAGRLLGFEISNMQARKNIEAKYYDQFLQDVKEFQELARRLNVESASRKTDAKWTVLEGELVLLLSLNSTTKHLDIVSDAWSELQIIQEWRPSLCLGRVADKLGYVPDSLRDAKRVAEVTRICQLEKNIVRYSDLGIYLLLYRLQGTEELEEFKRLYYYRLERIKNDLGLRLDDPETRLLLQLAIKTDEIHKL